MGARSQCLPGCYDENWSGETRGKHSIPKKVRLLFFLNYRRTYTRTVDRKKSKSWANGIWIFICDKIKSLQTHGSRYPKQLTIVNL